MNKPEHKNVADIQDETGKAVITKEPIDDASLEHLPLDPPHDEKPPVDSVDHEKEALKESVASLIEQNSKLTETVKKYEEMKVKSITVSAEVAGAILQAATNGTGYFNTTGSEHATFVRDGVVRIELQHEDPSIGRKTLSVTVNPTYQFLIHED